MDARQTKDSKRARREESAEVTQVASYSRRT